MGKRKKQKSLSSSSASNEDSCDQENKIASSIMEDRFEMLAKRMDDGFSKLHEDFDVFRHEIKSELMIIKSCVRDLEKSIEYTQAQVDILKETTKAVDDNMSDRLSILENQVNTIKKELQQDRENFVMLEQYSRRENLIFNHIKEEATEDCQMVVRRILEGMEINHEDMKFHAVHRLGKRIEGKTRPIIARFLSREDRDFVWKRKKNIKAVFREGYITQDYARTIKKERAILIKAMLKGRSLGMENIKVIDRHLVIDGERYNYQNIPSDLKEA